MALDRQQPDPRFTDADLRLAQRFAARAAVAVDLTRRVARTTVQRIVDGQEQERRRLSRELHDETGQALLDPPGAQVDPRTPGHGPLFGGACPAQGDRRRDPSGRPPPGRGAPPEGARRLRPGSLPSSGSRARSPSRPASPRTSSRACRGPPPQRDRDRALPRRPGGAHERRQARAGRARERDPAPPSRVGSRS